MSYVLNYVGYWGGDRELSTEDRATTQARKSVKFVWPAKQRHVDWFLSAGHHVPADYILEDDQTHE